MNISCTLSFLALSLTAAAQSIITDTRTGCQVLTENPSPLLSVTWSDECRDRWATGEGTLIWIYEGKEIVKYSGTMQGGLPHGKGKHTWHNGYVQEGNYFEGQFINLDDTYLARLEKIVLAKQDVNNLYVNDGASQQLFYYILKPQHDARGALILLADQLNQLIMYSTTPANSHSVLTMPAWL